MGRYCESSVNFISYLTIWVKLEIREWQFSSVIVGFNHKYLISVGTDWLTPIDGVLKNKLNFLFV